MISFKHVTNRCTKAIFELVSGKKIQSQSPNAVFVTTSFCKLSFKEVNVLGNCRSLSLDLFDQADVLDKTGQFRFTPPTHAILAFKQALDEFWRDGGVEGRCDRSELLA